MLHNSSSIKVGKLRLGCTGGDVGVPTRGLRNPDRMAVDSREERFPYQESADQLKVHEPGKPSKMNPFATKVLVISRAEVIGTTLVKNKLVI